MSILSLVKEYLSLRIDQLEIENESNREHNKLIKNVTKFISSGKLEKIINIYFAAWSKGDIDLKRGFKPTEDEKRKQ